MQQMNPMNNFNQINPMNNNIGMNFNNLNNMANLNNNFNNMNQQPFLFCNNIQMPIPQNEFPPIMIPQQNNMMNENFYNVKFIISSRNIICPISADKSIQDMIQIFKDKTLITNLEDIAFLYDANKIDINSQKKIKELFNNNKIPVVIVLESRPSVKINFNTSSGIKTQVKYYGCLCCSPFWFLLKAYLNKIGLDESRLKDLQFIFNGKILPNNENEAKKCSSTKYGINDFSTITVIDTKNLIGQKMKNK